MDDVNWKFSKVVIRWRDKNSREVRTEDKLADQDKFQSTRQMDLRCR